jgi:hypothetical protein
MRTMMLKMPPQILAFVLASFLCPQLTGLAASPANAHIHTRLKITITGCTNSIPDEHAVFDVEIANESSEPIRFNKGDLDTAFQIHTFRDADKRKWSARDLGVLADLPSNQTDFSDAVDPGKSLRVKVVTRLQISKDKRAVARPAEFKYSISDHITVTDSKSEQSFKAILIGEGKFKVVWVE